MLTKYIIETIKAIKKDWPLIIAFDGVDTSWKTTLADIVYETMKKENIFSPLRVQIDKFHNPKELRMKRWELSPEWFFYDSFNIAAIFENIIFPIKNWWNTINLGIFDYKVNQKIEMNIREITQNTVILFDGIFMNRDELYKYWDLSIFLDISFETVLKRAIKRDIEIFWSEENIKKRYNEKYIPWEKIYLRMCKPKDRADIIIDNNNYNAPIITKFYNNGK